MSAHTVKCIIWDLDNTIWDGILLEGDTVQLKPGMTELLATLDRRGILHSIASKNDHDLAMAQLEAFGIAEYFLYPQISWNAKSLSVERIQNSLNIAYDTLLFIDDQPFERDEVASVHPDVCCIDSRFYADLIEDARLKPRYITEDSRRRRQLYRADIARREEQETFAGPQAAFLRQLSMVLDIAEATESDLARAEELTFRTNQLNATGKTYTVEGLQALMQDPEYKLIVCELTDKYGSYGKIGLAVVAIDDSQWTLELMLFSCRVLSAGVGGIFLTYLRETARSHGVGLKAAFRDTGRNRMMRITYMVAGFKDESPPSDDGVLLLQNDLTEIPPLPDYVDIRYRVDWNKTIAG